MGSADLTMFAITEASTMIQEEAHEDANVIWGWVVDETMGDEARVTVIATGFDDVHSRDTSPCGASRLRPCAAAAWSLTGTTPAEATAHPWVEAAWSAV